MPDGAPAVDRASSATRSSAARATCCSTPARAAARPRCWSSGSSRSVLEDGVDGRGDPHDHVHREGGGRAARPDPARGLRAARRRRCRAGDRGRVHLDDPRLLRPRAARARAGGGARPAVRRARRARGRAARRRRVRRGARGPGPQRARRRRPDRRLQRRARCAAGSIATHAELRSRGQSSSRRCRRCRRSTRTSSRPRATSCSTAAAAALRASSARIADPVRRVAAGDRAARTAASRRLAASRRRPWPGELDGSSCPGGNGAALTHAGVRRLQRGARALRAACEHAWAAARHGLLDGCCAASASATRGASARSPGVDFEDLELLDARAAALERRAARALPDAL